MGQLFRIGLYIQILTPGSPDIVGFVSSGRVTARPCALETGTCCGIVCGTVWKCRIYEYEEYEEFTLIWISVEGARGL